MSGEKKDRLPCERQRGELDGEARGRVVFRHPVGARVTSTDDDEDVPRRRDAPKTHGDGRARRPMDSRRGYFLLAGKRRARRADNRASETARSCIARVRGRRLTQVGG